MISTLTHLLNPDGSWSLKPRKEKKKKGRKRKVSKVGKVGIVRLYGKDLEQLRRDCFERDKWHCRMCGRRVAWSHGISCFADEDWAWSNSLGLPIGQMAHIRTKRNNGDTLDNVRTLCSDCHGKEHNAGGKPCPAKRI
jgi:5-methylcytosine-specific restriction endonuclease McrA